MFASEVQAEGDDAPPVGAVFGKKRRLKMDSRRRFALILAITFPLLSLISNTAQTETGRVNAKVSAGVSERSGRLALDASSDNNALLNLLLGHTASHAFNEAAWAAQPSALPQAGMTFTVNSTADPGTGVCDAVE